MKEQVFDRQVTNFPIVPTRRRAADDLTVFALALAAVLVALVCWVSVSNSILVVDYGIAEARGQLEVLRQEAERLAADRARLTAPERLARAAPGLGLLPVSVAQVRYVQVGGEPDRRLVQTPQGGTTRVGRD